MVLRVSRMRTPVPCTARARSARSAVATPERRPRKFSAVRSAGAGSPGRGPRSRAPGRPRASRPSAAWRSTCTSGSSARKRRLGRLEPEDHARGLLGDRAPAPGRPRAPWRRWSRRRRRGPRPARGRPSSLRLSSSMAARIGSLVGEARHGRTFAAAACLMPALPGLAAPGHGAWPYLTQGSYMLKRVLTVLGASAAACGRHGGLRGRRVRARRCQRRPTASRSSWSPPG